MSTSLKTSPRPLLNAQPGLPWRARLRGVFVGFGLWLYRIWGATWRIEHIGEPRVEDAPPIYAHWHGDELVLVHAFRARGIAVMVSHSKDGAVMGRLLLSLGYRIVRGSSSRGGGPGLKGLIDHAREGAPTAVAVDGPRGPRGEVKLGIFKLAEATGRWIVPGAVACRRKIVFKKSWNQCFLPWPFARCYIVYGEPIRVETGVPDQPEKLARILDRLKLEADQLANGRG